MVPTPVGRATLVSECFFVVGKLQRAHLVSGISDELILQNPPACFVLYKALIV